MCVVQCLHGRDIQHADPQQRVQQRRDQSLDGLEENMPVGVAVTRVGVGAGDDAGEIEHLHAREWVRQVDAGLARFEEALLLNPDSANTLNWYASALLHVGRYPEALTAINRAQALQPQNRAILNIKAQALFYTGHVAEAVALLREMVIREPDYAWSHFALMKIQVVQGDVRQEWGKRGTLWDAALPPALEELLHCR